MVKRRQAEVQFKDKDKLSIEMDEPFIRMEIQLPRKVIKQPPKIDRYIYIQNDQPKHLLI